MVWVGLRQPNSHLGFICVDLRILYTSTFFFHSGCVTLGGLTTWRQESAKHEQIPVIGGVTSGILAKVAGLGSGNGLRTSKTRTFIPRK